MTTFEAFLAVYMGLLVPLFAALYSSHQKRTWQEIASLRAEVGGLRSDLVQVALAVGARPPLAEA